MPNVTLNTDKQRDESDREVGWNVFTPDWVRGQAGRVLMKRLQREFVSRCRQEHVEPHLPVRVYTRRGRESGADGTWYRMVAIGKKI